MPTPAAIVLGHHIPGDGFRRMPMQGLELLESLDTLHRRPVVLHSSDERMEDTAIRSSADAFVLKGEHSLELPETLRRLVSER